jgi:hypothetical protein
MSNQRRYRPSRKVNNIKMKYPLYLQKALSPRIKNTKPAGIVLVGHNPPKTGISDMHQSRFAHIPHVGIIKSPRAPPFSFSRLEDRVSSETKSQGVSFDAPRWIQIPYVRVHTPPTHLHAHRTLPISCRPGAPPTLAIGNLPAYHLTRGMLAEERYPPVSPISPRKTTQVPQTPMTPMTPMTPSSSRSSPRSSPRSFKTAIYDETIVNPQNKNLSVSLTSPLSNRRRTSSLFAKPVDLSKLESKDNILLNRLGFTNELLAEYKNTLLGPLMRDKRKIIHRGHVGMRRGLKRVVPPHMKNHSAAVVTKHIGYEATPNSLFEGGFCSLSPSQKRGNRKQFDGGHSGGKSSFLRLG